MGCDRRDGVQRLLGAAIRVLLACVFTLGGAWIAKVIPPGNGRPLVGGLVGFAIISVALLRVRSFARFFESNGMKLLLAGFLAYVILLGLAAYSELFDLGWFRWLSV